MELHVGPEFGYIVLVALGSLFQVMWMAISVGKARKKYNVNYPTMYSDKESTFNCIQRVHQNTLENYAQFLMCLFLGGLISPVLNACGGAIYVAARFFYAIGYYTGDPSKRKWGAFGYIGLLIMIFNTFRLALTLLGYL